MVIMAIDHTRDFFTSVRIDPTDPLHSWPALFATRWITHICAPGFVALAGVSIHLQRSRGKDVRQLRGFLLGRGVWLAIFDILGFGWIASFCLPPALIVGPLWVSGLSMMVLSILLRFRTRTIGLIGVAILLLHNLLDPIPSSYFGHAALVWQLLHEQAIVKTHGLVIAILYPLIPWIGIMAVGYSLGTLLAFTPRDRQRISALLGTGSLLAFGALRALRGYGDPLRYRPEPETSQSIMSFMNVTKYPPSLEYVLATGGVLLLLFSLFDLLSARRLFPQLRGWLDIYGRVPFFFFAVHLMLLHAAVVLLGMAEHLEWRQWLQPLAVLMHRIPGWGFELPVVYCVWVLLLFVMYWPCLWFARLKERRRDWWLSYL